MPKVKVGCCGFSQGMKDYFRQFKLVEVQQTFYKLPKFDTASKWRKLAPPDFEFTLKASQLITHPATSPTYRRARLEVPSAQKGQYGFFKPTAEVLQAWGETKLFAQAIGAKVIVFQCPASFTETAEHVNNLRKFFQSAHASGFLLVWEPRGEWSSRIIKTLCSELGLIHCVDPFEHEPLYGEPHYFRLHGEPRYKHHYTKKELEWLKGKLGDQEAYILFNNINMYKDALNFLSLLEAQ